MVLGKQVYLYSLVVQSYKNYKMYNNDNSAPEIMLNPTIVNIPP